MEIRPKTYQFSYDYWDKVKKETEEEYERLKGEFSIKVEDLIECEDEGWILEMIVDAMNMDLQFRVENISNYETEFDPSDRRKIEDYYWYLRKKLDRDLSQKIIGFESIPDKPPEGMEAY
jgi:membrane-bound lytic murein transglycosylase MltF